VGRDKAHCKPYHQHYMGFGSELQASAAVTPGQESQVRTGHDIVVKTKSCVHAGKQPVERHSPGD
jgi:hypothetical protein